MSLTPSVMLPLGTLAPLFTLPDTVSGKTYSLERTATHPATLIMFICNHCPYVKHVNAEIVKLAADYQPNGVSIIAISSNDAENYPQDAPDRMKLHAEQEGYTFPYLYDESQVVARAYHAACTPDFFLFDSGFMLVYRGRLDGATPGNDVPVTGTDLRAAMDAVLAGARPDDEQLPSVGCNIKWKAA